MAKTDFANLTPEQKKRWSEQVWAQGLDNYKYAVRNGLMAPMPGDEKFFEATSPEPDGLPTASKPNFGGF